MEIIESIYAREVLDSRGYPTVEVEVVSNYASKGQAIVPSGASTGIYEALELRDVNSRRYKGKGVLKAIENIHEIIAPRLIGECIFNQRRIDRLLVELDGTEYKDKLGANAILGVSLAVCRCAANALSLPLYRYIGGMNAHIMPTPMMNIINGGKHANNNVDFQEFMIMPVHASSFREGLQKGVEVFHALKALLNDKGYPTSVGDEGGFAGDFASNEDAIQMIMEAILQAGYIPGEDIALALDVAASELYKDGHYVLAGEGNRILSSEEMIDYYEMLCMKYPIVSIEDGLDQDDYAGWKSMTEKLGKSVQLVGDDFFVTNTKRLKKGIDEGCANAILIKFNQIGTLSETLDAIEMAQKAHYGVIISHRSGESEDTTIADLAVAVNAGQIKTGSASRSERISKYNQLLRIEDNLSKEATYLGKDAFYSLD